MATETPGSNPPSPVADTMTGKTIVISLLDPDSSDTVGIGDCVDEAGVDIQEQLVSVGISIVKKTTTNINRSGSNRVAEQTLPVIAYDDAAAKQRPVFGDSDSDSDSHTETDEPNEAGVAAAADLWQFLPQEARRHLALNPGEQMLELPSGNEDGTAQKWKILSMLGQGSFGRVYQVSSATKAESGFCCGTASAGLPDTNNATGDGSDKSGSRF